MLGGQHRAPLPQIVAADAEGRTPEAHGLRAAFRQWILRSQPTRYPLPPIPCDERIRREPSFQRPRRSRASSPSWPTQATDNHPAFAGQLSGVTGDRRD